MQPSRPVLTWGTQYCGHPTLHFILEESEAWNSWPSCSGPHIISRRAGTETQDSLLPIIYSFIPSGSTCWAFSMFQPLGIQRWIGNTLTDKELTVLWEAQSQRQIIELERSASASEVLQRQAVREQRRELLTPSLGTREGDALCSCWVLNAEEEFARERKGIPGRMTNTVSPPDLWFCFLGYSTRGQLLSENIK